MFVEHQDETSSHSDYPVIHAINRDVALNIQSADGKEETDYTAVAMRDLADTGAVGWERQSSGSEVSGVSLACLQGRIQQVRCI